MRLRALAAFIVGVFLMLCLILIVVFFSPINRQLVLLGVSDIKNWQFHSNFRGRFMYKAPPYWKNEEWTYQSDGGSTISGVFSQELIGTFTINYSLPIKDRCSDGSEYKWSEMKETEITVGGVMAHSFDFHVKYRVLGNTDTEFQERTVFFEHGGYCYLINAYDDTRQTFRPTFDRILSTFEFTN